MEKPLKFCRLAPGGDKSVLLGAYNIFTSDFTKKVLSNCIDNYKGGDNG
jgi:hypothetical protein